MTVYEQSDGLVPNKQTPPATSKLGASDALWGEVNATAISGTTINAAALSVLNRTVPAIYTATIDLVTDTALTVTHGLNNLNPMFIVYGSGTNEVLPIGSGNSTASIIMSASGVTADTFVLTCDSNQPGSTIVLLG